MWGLYPAGYQAYSAQIGQSTCPSPKQSHPGCRLATLQPKTEVFCLPSLVSEKVMRPYMLGSLVQSKSHAVVASSA
jgi:hypothetical protein